MKNFISSNSNAKYETKYENKSTQLYVFLNSLKSSKNEYGIVLDYVDELIDDDFYDTLKEEDKKYISETLRKIERYNLFLIEKKEFIIYKNFFEKITLEKINYSTFFSDLKRKSLFNLEKLCFQLILDQNRSLIQKFIIYLKGNNMFFQNDEETTIKILNLNIDDDIKKQYIDFNETKIKNIHKIISEKIRDYYIQKESLKIKKIFFK